MKPKLPSQPKTSQNLKFLLIKIAHRTTYIKWLWKQHMKSRLMKLISPNDQKCTWKLEPEKEFED